MHTILGAGGTIANELVKELTANNEPFRLVGRNPKSSGNATEVKRADLTDAASVKEAIAGSSIVYLVAGLQYNIKIWQEQWPKVMTNVIEGCKTAKAKLIFFDNVYGYGLVKGPMTEATPYQPCSKKGEVRARIATQLMDEVKRGNLHAAIARAADFYGPKSEKSVLGMMVFENLSKGKKAQWLLNANALHCYTYTPDAGKAVYMIAKNENAFDQVWHMPTALPALTGKEFIRLIAAAFATAPKYTVLPKFMIRLAGLFNRDIREFGEMFYQNEFDYIFDSSKFEKAFSFRPTSYEEGIKLAAATYKDLIAS
jgi:nucleoside-diphosphate-sugar epimerase